MRNLVAKIVVLAVLVVSIMFFIKQKRQPCWGLRILPIVFSFILLIAISIFPIENLFLTFPDAQSVFNYACTGTLTGIADGRASSFILYSTSSGGDSLSFMVVPKNSTGYKIGYYFSYQTVETIVGDNGLLLQIFCNQSKEDYYALIIGTVSSSEIAITDNLGSEFHATIIPIKDYPPYSQIVGYTRINGYPSNYQVNVNNIVLTQRQAEDTVTAQNH